MCRRRTATPPPKPASISGSTYHWLPSPNPRVEYERPTTNWYQGLELTIYRQLRMNRTPYTCTAIGGDGGLAGEHGTDVDHIAALAKAHDSGLRADDMLTFSGDPANLTLATPHDRTRKGGRDAADYIPNHNAGSLDGSSRWSRSGACRWALARRSFSRRRSPAAPRRRSRSRRAGTPLRPTTAKVSPYRPTESPPVQSFRNCPAMREAGWNRGVNRNGGTYRASWDDAEETHLRLERRPRPRQGRTRLRVTFPHERERLLFEDFRNHIREQAGDVREASTDSYPRHGSDSCRCGRASLSTSVVSRLREAEPRHEEEPLTPSRRPQRTGLTQRRLLREAVETGVRAMRHRHGDAVERADATKPAIDPVAPPGGDE